MPIRTRFRSGQHRSEGWFAAASLSSQADAYIQYLTERGYAARSIEGYFRSVSHFIHWLTQRDGRASEISEAMIDRFLDRHLPHCRCAKRCWRTRTEVRPALRHFLTMLRATGMCKHRISTLSPVIEAELSDFDRHLTEVRGLARSTRIVQRRHVQDFLTEHFDNGDIRIGTLTPPDISGFMSRYTAAWAPASIKSAGISLRSYFRLKASEGESTKALIAALPRVAQWRLSGLPETLSVIEIKRLLQAFDRSTATGRRDYAITRCLLDLGLRRAEVAQLQLEDVDWRNGTLSIHCKSKRVDVLPLPPATGQAITDYLQYGRPLTTRRELFVRHRPPLNAPADLDIIRNAVRNAAERCGLERRIRGTHIMRHTIACRLVQGGTPFKEIADLLRHRSLDTTTIYAKVDLPALARVAMPWPGRAA